MRLWDSLERLVLCHAKLMLRTRAGIEDALCVVSLMESTWGFGQSFTACEFDDPSWSTFGMHGSNVEFFWSRRTSVTVKAGRYSNITFKYKKFFYRWGDDTFREPDKNPFNTMLPDSNMQAPQTAYPRILNNYPDASDLKRVFSSLSESSSSCWEPEYKKQKCSVDASASSHFRIQLTQAECTEVDMALAAAVMDVDWRARH